MTTYETLAESAAEILSPVFPDADEVTFANLVDEVLRDLAARFEEVASK